MARMTAEERAKQILRAATEVFAKSNYRSATIGEIAEHAGISEPLIYKHFESKKALFSSILKSTSEMIISRWDSISKQSISSVERLREMGITYITDLRQFTNELKVLFQAVSEAGDTDIRALLAETYREYASYLEQVICLGQEKGEISLDVDAKKTAWEMVSIGASNSFFYILEVFELDLTDQIERIDQLVQRLRANPVNN